MKKVGVIDIGSNTIKLLVASDREGFKEEFVAVEESRISTGISKSKPVLLSESINRATEAIAKLVRRAEAYHVDELQVVATSAVRDAENGGDFASHIRLQCGYPVWIMSGEEEAEAIACGLQFDPLIHAKGNYLHFDLGGGSLEYNEIIAGRLDRAISMPLGAVRLTEMFIPTPENPIPEQNKHSIISHITKIFEYQKIRRGMKDMDIVFTGGSATISRALVCNEPIMALSADKSYLSLEQLQRLYSELSKMTFDERLKYEYLPENRADVVCAALIVLIEILKYTNGTGFYHSLFSLRHGLCARLLQLTPEI